MSGNQLLRIESKAPRLKSHPDKGIEVTRNDSFSTVIPTLLAATSLDARAANSSKVVVEHPGMANQAHPFDWATRACPDRHSTRAAYDRTFFIGGLRWSVYFSLDALQSVSPFS
jgi:hypothetical protein